MTRLKRSRRARRMDSQKLQNNIEETSKIPATSGVAGATSEIESNDVQPSNTSQPKKDDEDQASKEKIKKEMYNAALEGDWRTAKKLLMQDSMLASDKMSSTGETALHIAAACKHTKVVQELVKVIETMDSGLSSGNDSGITAFHYAAAAGIIDIAYVMMEKEKTLRNTRYQDEMVLRLPNTPSKVKMLPLHMAVKFGNRDMVSYLHPYTKVQDLGKEKLFDLFMDAIRNSMYDVALKLLENHECIGNECLATMVDGENRTALHLLAQRHDISDISARAEAILERFVTMFAAVPWLKRIFEQPLIRKRARPLAEKLWTDIQRLGKKELIKMPTPILHDAAKAGNVEFISMLTRFDPDLIWDINDVDKTNYTIFHIAASERQERVFRLIHKIGAMKNLIAHLKDDKDNNILHLVAKIAPPSRRTIVSGAALQMQRELMWFKEMEKILPTSCLNEKNEDGLRPRELFSKEHEDLLKEGETWMRDTADSCMLIATIMLTVAFTAAFTVPGGNNSEIGIPILLKRTWFKVFVASDAVAMFCATFSIMMFLSILTSRFQEDDFLVSLPRRLLFGLAGLFGSLLGTISAFTSAYFLIFNEKRAWPTVLGSFACVLLAIIFLVLHCGLIVDTIRSIFLSRCLFRSSKHSLFRK